MTAHEARRKDTVSDPLSKSFRCAECGAHVQHARSRPDATWCVRPGVCLPLPADVLLPTCDGCGEWFVDGALADAIQARLETSLAQSSAERTQ